MWAILPAKNFNHAKKRLAPSLTPVERQALFAAMLEDVLAVATNVDMLEGVLVLTRDERAVALAQTYGARVEREPANNGQSAAVERAANILLADGVHGVLTLPGDTPNVSASEIKTILQRHGDTPAMSIVPSHDGRGSNCVILSPPNLIPFHFGHDSLTPHLTEADARNITPNIINDLPGIALDIDTPADLATLLDTPNQTRARTYLNESGIAARFETESGRAGAA